MPLDCSIKSKYLSSSKIQIAQLYNNSVEEIAKN